MKILVTGGAGFIGSHLVDRLVQEGHEVVVADNLSTGKRRNLNRAAEFYKRDVQSSRMESVFRRERPVVLIHLAAQMNIRRSVEDPLFDAQVNILGMLNVLDQAVRYGTRKVIFASSGSAIYGEQDVFPAPESHATRPLSPYGISKLTGEYYLAYYQRVSGIQCVSLRFSNVFGPRQDPHGEAGVVAIFTQKMLAGEQPIINGNGRQTRDFIYVDDVVEAHMAVLGKDVQGIYNVGTAHETSVNELFGKLVDLTKSGCKQLYGPAKKGEQARSVVDASKLRQELGWEPRVSLDEGLSRTVEYFRAP
ncbi:MAG: UDP-glucose 4-epimerase [Nitrospirae bacterium RIFCSPLOWO2_12_FULL_63_8]|nr:MAG: UDP-glucose 4-epimerase [Nitrospirae bacterium RIFCSPLOWO2_12_FULL_63_8]